MRRRVLSVAPLALAWRGRSGRPPTPWRTRTTRSSSDSSSVAYPVKASRTDASRTATRRPSLRCEPLIATSPGQVPEQRYPLRNRGQLFILPWRHFFFGRLGSALGLLLHALESVRLEGRDR